MEEWYCIATTGRRERVAASALEAKGIETYAPKVAFTGPQTPPRALPQLFPGYVLARSLLDSLREILALWKQSHYLSAVGIHNLVGICGRPSSIPNNFVIELISHTYDGVFIAPGLERIVSQYSSIEPGTPVRILAGPFTGLLAKFAGMKGTERSIILVSMLGSQRTAEVDRKSIEPYILGADDEAKFF